MQITTYNLTGEQIEKISLDKKIFDGKINHDLLAQAVRVYQHNQRLNSAKAKTRAEVKLTTKKVYRQKGTGNARHGSKRAPIFVGGGNAHGPKVEQHYALKFGNKLKKQALRSAMNLLTSEKRIYIVAGFESLKVPKIKIGLNLLKGLKLNSQKITFYSKKDSLVLKKSIRNLLTVDVCNIDNINVFDLLKAQSILFTKDAFDVAVSNL